MMIHTRDLNQILTGTPVTFDTTGIMGSLNEALCKAGAIASNAGAIKLQ
jgi:hypothetical protein